MAREGGVESDFAILEGMNEYFDITLDWNQIVYNLIQLGIAFLLALPVAWNRERHAHGAGLRTFPLVSVASCAFMLVGQQVFNSADAEARVMYGIITGMGFIGGGAILKTKGNVVGTATASSLWNTGAIGVSVAFKLYEIALLLTLINFLVLRFARPFKKMPKDENSRNED